MTKILKKAGFFAALGFGLAAFTGCPSELTVNPSVRVTPVEVVVNAGETFTFTPSIVGIPGAYRQLEWSILETGRNAATFVHAGNLTVAVEELLTRLTVRASIESDPDVFGDAVVTVTASSPVVTSVTILHDERAGIIRGAEHAFTASVEGMLLTPATRTVSWSIVEAGTAAGTNVAAGVLTVAADETLNTFRLRATSTLDNTVSGYAVVNLATLPAQITAVSVGNTHTAAVGDDGSLWSWGSNEFSQIGDGGFNVREWPVRIGTDTDWESVAAGNGFTLALRTDGSLWAWGNNANGRTGLGMADAIISEPTRVGTWTDWTHVSAGPAHATAVRANGTLWSWGANANARTVRGTVVGNTHAPAQVGSLTVWRSVAAGNEHSVAIRTDGTIWAAGNAANGRLGIAHPGIGALVNLGQTVGEAGTGLQGGTDWESVSAGAYHSVAIRTDGSLWVWGTNADGRTGLGTTAEQTNSPARLGFDDDWASVSVGNTHTLAVRENGSLWAWGQNEDGRTGLGTTNGNQTTPQRIGNDYGWTAVATSAGSNYSMAIRNGELWAFGNNDNGQLGDGTRINRTAPVRVIPLP